MTDYRALCAELIEAVLSDDSHIDCVQIARRARAALAHPTPPAEGEVGELVAWLRDAAFDLNGSDPAKSMLTRAADLLAQRHPAPVPVSERLPGPEDCDAEGRCWIYMPDIGTAPSWRLVNPRDIGPYHTHWLPAHALPLPATTRDIESND